MSIQDELNKMNRSKLLEIANRSLEDPLFLYLVKYYGSIKVAEKEADRMQNVQPDSYSYTQNNERSIA